MGQISFEKSIHTALWGAESWEISAHPSDPSVIAGGEEKGRRLNEVYPDFPLLFKVIDAKTRLSVQVLPYDFPPLRLGPCRCGRQAPRAAHREGLAGD